MQCLVRLAVVLLAFSFAHLAHAADNPVIEKAREIEARLGARVGLAIYDTESDRSWLYNANQLFPMTSTFKVLACGSLLHEVDLKRRTLDWTVTIDPSDLIPYAPVTERLVGQEVSLGRLCAATMRTSDNVAANKVLDSLGGPDKVTAFVRGIGDTTTRLDRREPDLNEATPGDPRDTTSPAAIAATLRKLVLGSALSGTSRDQLTAWLVANEVGGPLLRASLPSGWRIGDRTGAGGHGSRGIVAVLWPPARKPIVAAIFITGTSASMAERNAAIADLGKALAAQTAEAGR